MLVGLIPFTSANALPAISAVATSVTIDQAPGSTSPFTVTNVHTGSPAVGRVVVALVKLDVRGGASYTINGVTATAIDAPFGATWLSAIIPADNIATIVATNASATSFVVYAVWALTGGPQLFPSNTVTAQTSSSLSINTVDNSVVLCQGQDAASPSFSSFTSGVANDGPAINSGLGFTGQSGDKSFDRAQTVNIVVTASSSSSTLIAAAYSK